MKKKSLALLGVAALAGLSLASCAVTVKPVESGSQGGQSQGGQSQGGQSQGSNLPEKYVSVADSAVSGSQGSTLPSDLGSNVTDTKGLDICINYTGKQGITLREASVTNTVENQTYTQGNLLPTWKAFQKNLGIKEIRDASNYSASKDNDYYAKMEAANFASETAEGQIVDLFYNTTSNINTMGAAGKAIDLKQHLDKMPNFAEWIKNNPTMAKALEKGGKIFYTPYFDGYQDVERMFVMDTSIAEAVLDAADFSKFDTALSGKGGAANTLKEAAYTPVIDSKYNYPYQVTEVPALKNGQIITVSIKNTENIIVRQNRLLKQGVSGKALAEDFRAYLDEAFEGQIGEGKTFENYSDIFISESASYNADELIALMRVVKANPGLITGDPSSEVTGLFPRGQANNRVDNMADFMQIWGVQGMTSKKEMLYFDANGKINDAASTLQTYDALECLSAIYDEGLIQTEFWNKDNSTSGTYYLDRYFGKTADNYGYGLMMYDYAASTGATNDIKDGIGTKAEKRKVDVSVQGVRAILPPLAWWATSSEFDAYNQELRDTTGKSLIRYSEENRSLKSNSWCIPSNSDNIDVALRLMDYMFSAEGSRIQDFGPDDGRYWSLENGAPQMSAAVKNMVANSNTDFWSFMRGFVGSTHGIGCIRSTAIQIQCCNAYAQVGLQNLENAHASGVVYANRVDKHGDVNSWDNTVPTAGYSNPGTDQQTKYEALGAFWASDKNAQQALGWVAVVSAKAGTMNMSSTQVIGQTATTAKNYSYADVFAQIDARISNYVYTLANSLGSTFVPDYVKEIALEQA